MNTPQDTSEHANGAGSDEELLLKAMLPYES